MISQRAEIVPGIGLGGLLLGQSLQGLPWEEHWLESDTIVRGTLAQGAIAVVGDPVRDQIIGLGAQGDYQGLCPLGMGLGQTFAQARQRCPQLRLHDLEPTLYEPRRLSLLLAHEDSLEAHDDSPITSLWICDWAHDYWNYRRPLVEEADVDEDE